MGSISLANSSQIFVASVSFAAFDWRISPPPPSPPPPPPPQSCCLTKRSTQHCLGLKVKAVKWNSKHIVSLKDKTTGPDKKRILREELPKVSQKKIQPWKWHQNILHTDTPSIYIVAMILDQCYVILNFKS